MDATKHPDQATVDEMAALISSWYVRKDQKYFDIDRPNTPLSKTDIEQVSLNRLSQRFAGVDLSDAALRGAFRKAIEERHTDNRRSIPVWSGDLICCPGNEDRVIWTNGLVSLNTWTSPSYRLELPSATPEYGVVPEYDFDRGAFPIASGVGGRHRLINQDDYCSGVARSMQVFDLANFPMAFEAVGPDGSTLDAQSIGAMVGDLKMSQGDAKEFYANGFPTVVITLRGPVAEISPPGSSGAGLVRIVPQQITFRTQGHAQFSRVLAVYGPDEITLAETAPSPEAITEQQLPELDPAMGAIAYLKEHRDLLDRPEIASDLAYWNGGRGCTQEGQPGAQNQFETQRLLDAASALAKAKLASLDAPSQSRISFEFRLAGYDMETESFPVGFGSREPQSPDRFTVSIDREGARFISNCVTNRDPVPQDGRNVTFIDAGAVARFPLDPARAEALLTANFQPLATVEMEVVHQGFSSEGFPSSVVRVTHVAFRDTNTGDLLYERNVAPETPPEKTAWDTAIKADVASLLLHQLRSRPNLAENPGFAGVFLAATNCGALQKAAGNPISLARLSKDAEDALAAKLAEPAPESDLFLINFAYESLGDYDLSTESFPFTPHGEFASFYNKVYVVGLSNVCIPKNTNGLPGDYKLNLTEADALIAAGMPMSMDRAEAFIERYNSMMKDGRETKVRVEVLAEIIFPGANPVVDANNRPTMPGNARLVAMRVIDPKDGSVIYEVGGATPKTAANVMPEPAPTQMPSTTAEAEAFTEGAEGLTVVGIRLGMPLAEAISRFGDVGKIIYRATVEPAKPELVQDRYTLILIDNGESFVFHTAVSEGAPVIGIARRIPVNDNIPIPSIRSAFVDAYGAPEFEDDNGGLPVWRWEKPNNRSAANVPCVDHFITGMSSGTPPVLVHEEKDVDAILAVFEDAGMFVTRQDQSFFGFYLKERLPSIGLSMMDRLGGCGVFLNAWYLPSQTNPDQIWVHLVDPMAFAHELKNIAETAPTGFKSKL